jgi:hypothetical protein
MIPTQFRDALKGINGGYEINRLIGAIGGFIYVLGAHVFVGYEVFWRGVGFDITAYCLAFPGGLAVIVGGTAGAVALKDRNVATARVVEKTGSQPADPPAPAPQVQPELADKPKEEEATL